MSQLIDTIRGERTIENDWPCFPSSWRNEGSFCSDWTCEKECQRRAKDAGQSEGENKPVGWKQYEWFWEQRNKWRRNKPPFVSWIHLPWHQKKCCILPKEEWGAVQQQLIYDPVWWLKPAKKWIIILRWRKTILNLIGNYIGRKVARKK